MNSSDLIFLDSNLTAHGESTVVSPSPDASATVLEDKAVLLNLETGRYYTLNRLGTELWKQLSTGCTLTTLLSFLFTQKGATRERATTDLSVFLDNLAQEGLIQLERN